MSGLERTFSAGLEWTFLSGQNRLELPRFEVQLVDIGLALAPALNGQQTDRFQGFEVAADATLVQAQIVGKAKLAGEAKVILPRVAEQHGESHLVAGAELL